MARPRAFVSPLPLPKPYPDQGMVLCSFRSVSTCLLTLMPVSLPYFEGCASSIAVCFYFIHQRPKKMCIILSVTMYMITPSFWTATVLQIVPFRDTNRHTEGSMFAMYIVLHIVQSGPVTKYRLCLRYLVLV